MVWTPSGDEITFASFRGGKIGIYSKRWDGDGKERVLVSTPMNERNPDWSPGQKYLMSTAGAPQTKSQVVYRERREDGTLGEPVFFSKSAFNQGMARFSPDGRFVAYVRGRGIAAAVEPGRQGDLLHGTAQALRGECANQTGLCARSAGGIVREASATGGV